MKKIVLLILSIFVVTASGCSANEKFISDEVRFDTAKVPAGASEEYSENSLEEEESTEEPWLPDDVPGISSSAGIINQIADWAEYDKGILRLEERFESAEAKKHFRDYGFTVLEDGSIIGYVEYTVMQSTQSSDGEYIVFGEGTDFITDLVTDIAEKNKKASHIDYRRKRAFFIIADEGKIDDLRLYSIQNASPPSEIQ